MGYLSMSKVLNHFKTDLFLNSVTESSKCLSVPPFSYMRADQTLS